MEFQQIYEGVYRVLEKGETSTTQINGRSYYRIMDFFYTHLPADELSLEEVSELCRARAEEPRCFEGPNQKIKRLFNDFLKNNAGKAVLEIGAGTNPILLTNEALSLDITYLGSDADNKYSDLIHFDASQDLPNDTFFDVVISLFVLHFRFYDHQISQLYSHMKPDGIFLANVYNRTAEARGKLKFDFEKCGFKVEYVEDPKKTCRDHYYFFASKNFETIKHSKALLLSLIKLSF